MKTLHLYLLRQVAASLAMTVLVFTFVLLLGNLLREILALLVSRQATLGLVLQALGLLIPFVMVYALPMGLLTATLLVFGRFSADQELTAARAGGISLLALAGPILLLALALAGLSGWFNLQLAPQCRVAYKSLLYQLGIERPAGPLAENRLIKEFPGYLIFVGAAQGNLLKNVVVYQMDTNTPTADPPSNTGPRAASSDPVPARPALVLTATEATVTLDPTNQQVRLFFPEVEGVYLDSWQPGGGRDQVLELPARIRTAARQDLKLTEMTFAQLMREYYEFRRRGVDATPVAVQMHRQAAFSFASLGFAMVGIPLGVRAHRRETSAGVALALVLVVFYYAFIILGQAWETRPERWPQAILWLPNLLFQAVGAWLLWRADR
jgi:lipopolysaccharide export system permease protein